MLHCVCVVVCMCIAVCVAENPVYVLQCARIACCSVCVLQCGRVAVCMCIVVCVAVNRDQPAD